MPANPGLNLRTERLIIREFQEADWPAMHEYASDPETVQYVIFGPNTEQDTREYLQKVIARQQENPRQVYNGAIVEKTSRALIGSCTLILQSPDNRIGELGYILNRRYWNRGYMTEAVRRLISFGFAELGVQRIFATCNPANTGSYRVMEKAGMQKEGYLRSSRFVKGAWSDALQYAILQTDWQSRQQDAKVKAMSKNREIEYIEKNREDLDLVQPLWEKLNAHHLAISLDFKDHFQKMNFKIRKEELLKKSRDGALHIVLARDRQTGQYVGMSVASLNAEKLGELESIYVEKDYRGGDIGDGLITRVLGWLESMAAATITLGVGGGNENVFGFYRRYGFYPRITILERKKS
jgi:[ribosomal protein S5]-alanine N-acetyltransferase